MTTSTDTIQASQRSDLQLLRSFADDSSQEAFAELAKRHVDWVYSTAIRLVRDQHLADDVTQAVFVILAKKAGGLTGGRVSLTGWLFKVTRYSAANALRSKSRRDHHERQAAAMNSELARDDSQHLWNQIEPELDDLVDKLRQDDREAILLRFYQRKSMAEVGTALHISEDAAKKRISRAIDRLRDLLQRRGIVAPLGAVMTPMLLTHVTASAPAAIAALCASAPTITATAAVFSISKGAMALMLTAKTKIIAAIVVVAVALPVGVGVGVVINGSKPKQAANEQAASQPVQTIAATTHPKATDPAIIMQNRIQCAGNLKAIGNALILYSHDNRGAFPPDLGTLFLSQDMTAETFICPNSGNDLPAGASRRQIADWITSNGDYAYIPGWTQGANPEILIAYDRESNESGRNVNVLYGDGHIEFKSVEALRADIAKSVNSPNRKK